jgi:hypothetical protein
MGAQGDETETLKARTYSQSLLCKRPEETRQKDLSLVTKVFSLCERYEKNTKCSLCCVGAPEKCDPIFFSQSALCEIKKKKQKKWPTVGTCCKPAFRRVILRNYFFSQSALCEKKLQRVPTAVKKLKYNLFLSFFLSSLFLSLRKPVI